MSANWMFDYTVHHESELERKAILALLLAPGVEELRHQAIRLHVELEGRKTYVPDLFVRLEGGKQEVIEVRPSRYIQKDVELFRRASALLAQRGTAFFVVSELQLSAVKAKYVELCNYCAKREPTASDIEKLVREVRLRGRLSVDEALGLPVTVQVIAHAVGRRMLTAGPTVDLSPEGWLTPMESLDEDLSAGSWLGCAPWHAHMEV